jgi:Oxidoreductase molybdopterin binding domain
MIAVRQIQVLGCMLLACLAFPALAREEKPAPPTLQVSGEDGKSVTLSAEEWARLPRSKIEVKGKDDAVVRYDGVALAEVLGAVKISFKDHPRDRAGVYVLIEGSDGYRAVLALVEVDPKVSERTVLVADQRDGKPLADKEGPYRLVLPGDKVPVRWVRQVSRIGVRRPAEDAPRKKDSP